MKKLKVALIGAGNRGIGYTDIMGEMPQKYEIVAVAEPVESRRNYIKQKHNLSPDMCFEGWDGLFEKGKIADVVIIATMDRQHFDPVMKAIELGYDILLEKPISPIPYECKKIAQEAQLKNVKIIVCHVLRYSDMFTTLKKLIDDGAVGKIISVNHEECVGNEHYSHSFVRGNWGNSKRSSFMLLQKSCHDMDILQWLIGKRCKKIQSFGALNYFRVENSPECSPEYCIEGCPSSGRCPYDAVRLYLNNPDKEWAKWFRTTSTKKVNPSDEDVKKAISTTQYGKCVFKCDNDVVDHQTVNMLFEDDITVTFTMSAYNKGGRFIHIMGTNGEIRAAIEDDAPITIYDFETKQTKEIQRKGRDGVTGGHAGGDNGIISTLYDYLIGAYDGNAISEIGVSCDNHLMVFAAEKSRMNDGVMVDMDEFKKEVLEM